MGNGEMCADDKELVPVCALLVLGKGKLQNDQTKGLRSSLVSLFGTFSARS